MHRIMEQLLLKEYDRLPEHLKTEVLHFVQFLASKVANQGKKPVLLAKERTPLTFAEFRFPENGKTYGRSDIYDDHGR